MLGQKSAGGKNQGGKIEQGVKKRDHHLVRALLKDGGKDESDEWLHWVADLCDEGSVGLKGSLACQRVCGAVGSLCQAVHKSTSLYR